MWPTLILVVKSSMGSRKLLWPSLGGLFSEVDVGKCYPQLRASYQVVAFNNMQSQSILVTLKWVKGGGVGVFHDILFRLCGKFLGVLACLLCIQVPKDILYIVYLFRPIVVFCGTDSILQNIPHIQPKFWRGGGVAVTPAIVPSQVGKWQSREKEPSIVSLHGVYPWRAKWVPNHTSPHNVHIGQTSQE